MKKDIVYVNEYALEKSKNNNLDYAEYGCASSRLLVIHQHSGIISECMPDDVHAHNFYEAEFVYSGNGTHVLNNASFEMEKGCAYLRLPNNFHTTIQNPDNIICSYKLQFSADWVPEDIASYLIFKGNALFVKFADNEFDNILQKIKELKCEMQCHLPHADILIKALFNEILVGLVRHHKTEAGDFTRYNSYVSEALNYINSNFKDNLSVNEVAEKLNLNPHYLGMLFSKDIGIGMLDYILELKLQLAARLLVSSKMPVNEIAGECGFCTVSYFIKKFKKRFSLTPLKYRMTFDN